MITATQAKMQSSHNASILDSIEKSQSVNNWDFIQWSINNAILHGLCQAHIRNKECVLSIPVIDELTALGYRVQLEQGLNDNIWYVIQW